MNRVYRQAFLKTSNKVLLIPACMRLLPAFRCQAEIAGKVLQCVKCSEGCNVGELTRLGEERYFRVVMVPHVSSISSSLTGGPRFDTDTGVVGVACVLNLISGGWMLEDMGVPPQCVILNFCGCRNHWLEEEIPTRLDLENLKKVMG